MPEYRTDRGRPVAVPGGLSIDECPTGFITPWSREQIGRRNRMKSAWDNYGLQAWPPGEVLARDMDALITLDIEASRYEQAKAEAEAAEFEA